VARRLTALTALDCDGMRWRPEVLTPADNLVGQLAVAHSGVQVGLAALGIPPPAAHSGVQVAWRWASYLPLCSPERCLQGRARCTPPARRPRPHLTVPAAGWHPVRRC